MSVFTASTLGWCVTDWRRVLVAGRTPSPGVGTFARVLCLLACLLSAELTSACGWWGDGEERGLANVQRIGADGRPMPGGDPMESPARMVELGDAFRTGVGAPRDLNLALHWYRLAAERGHAGGQYNLALAYELGLGVVRDQAQAAHWYLQAARQHDVHAQHHLGRMLIEGRGVDRDQVSGVAWLERAARQGHDEVFLSLAEAYGYGRGAALDPGVAYAWCWLAELRGNASANPLCEELAAQLDEPRLQEARELAAGLVGYRVGKDGWR